MMVAPNAKLDNGSECLIVNDGSEHLKVYDDGSECLNVNDDSKRLDVDDDSECQECNFERRKCGSKCPN
uniref:Uncharacterized protein n=1 Tax=Vitis vinifera TaxID=29760 RepID=A5BS66_VITVI|nr:hypothetical protein VITISV_036767 [Vitis vinifera]